MYLKKYQQRKRMDRRGRGPIPKTWINCPNMSETIVAGRFIIFKTPLSTHFFSQMDMEDVFIPEMIFSWCYNHKVR